MSSEQSRAKSAWKWFEVSENGGKEAVHATSPEAALQSYCRASGRLDIDPGVTVKAISAEEAEKYYYILR